MNTAMSDRLNGIEAFVRRPGPATSRWRPSACAWHFGRRQVHRAAGARLGVRLFTAPRASKT